MFGVRGKVNTTPGRLFRKLVSEFFKNDAPTETNSGSTQQDTFE